MRFLSGVPLHLRIKASGVAIPVSLGRYSRKLEMVGVAQLVEPRIVIPVVAGSIPVVHPINLLYKATTPDEIEAQLQMLMP